MAEAAAGLGLLEERVGDRVVEVVLEQHAGVAPLGDDDELRVELEVRGLLGLEVLDPEAGEPARRARRRDA
jgi:hypothetical protein